MIGYGRLKNWWAGLQVSDAMKEFASQIYAAINEDRLNEPFGPDDVKRACPGWANHTYTNFLPKHAIDNPGKNTELFERVAPGRYRALPNRQVSN